MSAELYDDLTDHMTGDAPTAEGFTVDSLESADWAVRKIGQHRRRYAAAVDVATAEQGRIVEWLAEQEQRCEQATSYLVELLARYHHDLLVDDPKAKTVRLPSGELIARKRPDSLLIDESDEHVDETFAWCEANLPEAVVVRKSFDKNTLKRKLRPSATEMVGDGFRAIDPATGELVPGVMFKVGEVSFKVETA